MTCEHDAGHFSDKGEVWTTKLQPPIGGCVCPSRGTTAHLHATNVRLGYLHGHIRLSKQHGVTIRCCMMLVLAHLYTHVCAHAASSPSLPMPLRNQL